MTSLRTLAAFGLGAALASAGGVSVACAAEENLWPFWVGQTRQANNGETVESWLAAGPFAFYQPLPPALGDPSTQAGGVRPFYVWKKDSENRVREGYTLYPFFTYRTSLGGSQRWSFFNLVNYSTTPPMPIEAANGKTESDQAFDVWPFYFSNSTGNPNLDYRAVFPIAGTIKRRLGYDRLSWVLFPLYGRFEKKEVVRNAFVWPFIKVTSGDGNRGFELWPIYGQKEKPGVYRNRFLIWPLFYKNETYPENAPPEIQLGALPFYAMDRSEGYLSKTWVWPFFGYVDRTAPYRYHASNYFWPLFVQGRGDDRYVNRWGPFYTHSIIKGTDRRWVMWPLWRQLSWREDAIDQTKTQFLFFLYNSTLQTSATNPAAAAARKTHVWPLWSSWDNGAGRRQVQVLSPFEVFFPHNEPMRLTWSPFFALYRYDHRPDGRVRHSLLWDGVTYLREPERGESEFHLGPLFSVETRPDERRIALGNGLIGLKRGPARSWRLFFGEFKSKSTPTSPVNPP